MGTRPSGISAQEPKFGLAGRAGLWFSKAGWPEGLLTCLLQLWILVSPYLGQDFRSHVARRLFMHDRKPQPPRKFSQPTNG